jgi:tryptophanyl-tRNA synthetase
MCAELRKLGAFRINQQLQRDLEIFYTLAHTTPVSELARLPQYQTKEQTLHMLSYPLLMASDIIISDCDGVIV